ncbi:MAG: hypothetical protein ACI8XU_002404, partial [Kiritimatiellia bacterium]
PLVVHYSFKEYRNYKAYFTQNTKVSPKGLYRIRLDEAGAPSV